MAEFLTKLEPVTKMPLVDRMAALWSGFKTEQDIFVSVEKQCADIFERLKPGKFLVLHLSLKIL